MDSTIKEIIGKTYKMYRLADMLVLKREGEPAVKVLMDNFAIRENTYDRYFWFSPDDHFEQGSDCEVIDVVDNVWYIRNKTWDPNIFADLPSRCVAKEDIEGTEFDEINMYLYLQNGTNGGTGHLLSFIEPDGKHMFTTLKTIRVVNDTYIEPGCWHECRIKSIDEGQQRYLVTIIDDKVPTIRDFLYATVDG